MAAWCCAAALSIEAEAAAGGVRRSLMVPRFGANAPKFPSLFLARPARCKLPARSRASAPARPCPASQNRLRARSRYATAGPGARRRSTNRPRRTPADAGAERRTNRGRIPRNRASATRGVIRRALTPIGPSRHNVPEKRGRSPFASDCSGETFHAPRKRDPTPFLLRHFSCAISPATNVLTAQPFACTCDVTRVTCLRVVCAPAPLHSITAAPRLTTTCFTRSWLTHDAPQRERT
jgi:hypothetical protein